MFQTDSKITPSYQGSYYLKAGAVFAATTVTYILARTSGMLGWLWRAGVNDDNPSGSEAELSSAVIQMGDKPTLTMMAEGRYAFDLDSSSTVLPELAPMTQLSTLPIVDFSEREIPALELTDIDLAKLSPIKASAETETEVEEVIEIDTEHYRVPSRQSRRLLQTGSGVTVINPIPDQFIEATTAYQRDLSSVFSGKYNLITAKLQNGSTLPGWLSAQYDVILGSYTVIDTANPVSLKGPVSLQMQNGIAYLGLSAFQANGLLVLNVSDPKNIVSLGYYMYNCGAVPVIVQDGVAYQGCRSFTVWNVSNLSAVVSIGQFNLQYSEAYVVVIQGNLAYVGDNSYFEVLNVANPSSITRLNSVLLDGVDDIYLQNNRAYLIDGSRVRIVDVSNPSNLIFLGAYTITTPNVMPNDIQVKNGVAYVVTRRGGLPPPYSATGLLQGGLLILDVSSPTNIKLLNSYYLEPDYYGYRLQVDNGMVYMVGAQVDGVGNFLVVNATDITSIALVGNYRTSGAGPLRDLYIQNGLAYLCGADGLLIVDLTHMQLVGMPTAAHIDEHHLIQISVFDSNGTVLAVDDFELSTYHLPPSANNTLRNSSVFPGQPFVLTIDTTDGVWLTTALTSPLKLTVQVTPLIGSGQLTSAQLSLTPTFLGSTIVPNITYGIGDIYVSGDLVYIAGSVGSGLCIYDVSNPVNIRRIGFYPLYEAKSIQVQGSLAYVGDNYVLRIFDVSNVANIVPLDFYTTPYFVYDLAVENGIAYVAQGYSGFYVYDVGNPNSISLLGSTTTGLNHANGVQVQNRIAYVADDRALVIFNVSNPVAIGKIISFPVGGASLQLHNGLLAYGGFNNYQLYDVSDLNAIQLLFSYDYTAQGGIHNGLQNVQIESDFGYVVFNGGSGSSGGLEVWDISDPRNVSSLAVYDVFNAWFVKVNGSLAYLVGDAVGLGWFQVLDLSQWQWSLTPNVSDEGNYRVTAIGMDAWGNSVSDHFMLRVEGPPRINGTMPSQQIKVGQMYVYTVPEGLITDPNEDNIILTANLENKTSLPAWLSFNTISATFTGTPQGFDVGNYTVILTATDSISDSVSTAFTLSVDRIPGPTLILNQGETITIMPSNLMVVDTNLTNSVNFTITDLQHGQFLLRPLNDSVTQFTQEQVLARQVLFQQDGSPLLPGYAVTVSDLNTTVGPLSAVITFYRQPVLQTPVLTIHQNQTVLVGIGEFNVTEDYPADQVVLTIHGSQHGQFVLSNGTRVEQWSQQQLQTQKISFKHDGSSSAPSYAVGVSDAYFTLPPQNARILFYPQPYWQLSPTFTLHQNETVLVSNDDLPVVKSDPGEVITFIVGNLQQGRFAWSNGTTVTRFSEQQSQAGAITLIHDGLSLAPSCSLSASNGYVILPAQNVNVTFYPAPVLQMLTLIIHQNETRSIHGDEWSVIKSDPEETIQFTISDVQHGRFVSSNGTVITEWSEQALQAGNISLRHDGSSAAPSYSVGIRNPYMKLPSQNARILFYLQPVLQPPSLMVHQNEARRVGSDEFSVLKSDPSEPVKFIISNLQHGRFVLSNGTVINEWDEQSLADGNILFIHDGSLSAPSYTVSVGSAYMIGSPAGANVTFYPQPKLQSPTLIIHQNETRLIGNDEWLLLKSDPADSVTFTVSDVQYGRFMSRNGTTITEFSEQAWEAGNILFVHDGSSSAPSYRVSVSDADSVEPPVAANVTFYPEPILQPLTLVIHQNETRPISSRELSVWKSDLADPIKFSINRVKHGRFVYSNGTVATEFSEQPLQAGHISFVHDGSSWAPTYQVIISDPYMTLPPQEAQVSFYRWPVLQPPGLTITQGGHVTINSTAAPLVLLNEDYPADQVIFNVTQVKGGYFFVDRVNTSEPITFTAAQLQAEEIGFQQDGSVTIPGYTVSVKDPYYDLPAVPVSAVYFHKRPVLVNNSLTINRHGTLIIRSAELGVSADVADDQVTFTIMGLSQGEFVDNSLASHPVITRFNQGKVKGGYIQFYHTAQAGDAIQTKPNYCVRVDDGVFTLETACAQINYNFSYDQPKIIGVLPDKFYGAGSTINFLLNMNVFAAQNGEALTYSAALSTGDNLPSVGLSFGDSTHIIAGSVSQPGKYNISVTATSIDHTIAATTYFLLQISRSASSFFADAKSLVSVFASIGGTILAGLAYLYGVYHYRRKRQFEHPFANEVHIRLNLSYVNFFENEGKTYKDSIVRMMGLLQQQNGVDLNQLRSSPRREDKNLYYYYADLFADVICKRVNMRSVYCCTSQELRLTQLQEREQVIVNEIVLHARRASPARIVAAGGIRWCSFFTDMCCASRRRHRLSLVLESELELPPTQRERTESKEQKRLEESSRKTTDELLLAPTDQRSDAIPALEEVGSLDTGEQSSVTFHHMFDLR